MRRLGMNRDLTALANQNFDVLVIGGGIFGAGVARDAALRGLRVARLMTPLLHWSADEERSQIDRYLKEWKQDVP